MVQRSGLTRVELVVGLAVLVIILGLAGFGASKWSDARVRDSLVDMVHADEAQARADSIAEALESLLTADSVRHAQALDSIRVLHARVDEASERGESARIEGERIAESLRASLDSVQTVQFDSVVAASEERVEAITVERDAARAEALLWRTRFDDVSGTLALSRSETAELRESNERLRSVVDAERAIARSARRKAMVWKGIALTEAIGGAAAALVLISKAAN